MYSRHVIKFVNGSPCIYNRMSRYHRGRIRRVDKFVGLLNEANYEGRPRWK
jgi:hypothetical protein